MRFIATALCLVGILAMPALAEDFLPPEFRGDPLTVKAVWEFIDDFNPNPMSILPDDFSIVGDGVHEFHHDETHGHADENVFWENGRARTDELPGGMGFYVANWIDDYLFKHIWVQLHFGGEGVPFVSGVVGPNVMDDTWNEPLQYGQLFGTVEVDPNRRVEHWLLEPNPNREFIDIHIPPFTWLEQIVIDTISTNDNTSAENQTLTGIKNLFR